MRVLTGVDLPWGSPGGSVELIRDLYLTETGPLDAHTFMLEPAKPGDQPFNERLHLLDTTGKCLDGPAFWSYVGSLGEALKDRFSPDFVDVLHLHHLTFGATPALLSAYPDAPSLALVHGTDLLHAAKSRTQCEVLTRTARTCDAVVVPTLAMADRLRGLLPDLSVRVEHIPWGVPETLLARPPRSPDRRTVDDGMVRLLYAGRLTEEKGFPNLLAAIEGNAAVRLSVAAPPAEFTELARHVPTRHVRYLGWLRRADLWREFGNHDLLVVPSTELEAFGLVAVEAQASGLPVLYQPVPGLSETVGEGGLAVDLTAGKSDFARTIERIQQDGSLLPELRLAGYANAEKYRISRTAAALAELSEDVLARRSRFAPPPPESP
jgi:glycosyltransferase involved in cell wall biosynthesis